MTAPWAVNLKKLQDKDLRIRVLTGKLAMIPKEQINLKNQAAANRTKVEKAKNDVLELELQQKKAESRINAHKETIHKLETQSNMVKKNTEYQTMMDTIAMLKKAIGDHETRSLELMDLIEEDAGKIRAAEASAKLESAGLREEYEELRSLYRDVQLRIRELEKERPALRECIDSEVLPRYEMILSKNSGVPLVAVKAGKCGHCHLSITPQTLNNARGGAVASCDHCMYLIYMD